MSARKFDCPYCQHRMRDVFNEIANGTHGPHPAPNVCVLCTACGEPIFMETQNLRLGWRKPNDAEFEAMRTDPGIARARAAWLHMQQKRPDQLLVEKTWLHFLDHVPLQIKEMGEPTQFLMKVVYMTAFSNAYRIFTEIGSLDNPEDYFDMQCALIKAELNVFHTEAYERLETMQKEQQDNDKRKRT